jgi:hypothetical protein
MALTRIFDPEKNPLPMKVAAFMSGSGTNIIRLIEKEQALKRHPILQLGHPRIP